MANIINHIYKSRANGAFYTIIDGVAKLLLTLVTYTVNTS